MHQTIINLNSIKEELKLIDNKLPSIIAVSKTFKKIDIMPLIESGHIHFGENKVQEALEKWQNIKKDHLSIKLHMIGKLQTNKVKYVVPLFDYLHSLDNIKLAKKISLEEKKMNKKLKIFIQINLGNEEQKSGIKPEELIDFYKICKEELSLNIIGLMCLPPNNKNVTNYFSEMQNLKSIVNLNELSMGMSNDYLQAIKYGSTYVRIGSKIFGMRT